MNAQQKVAVVTGAGGGIGRETALLLASSGYGVVLVGRTRRTLEQTAEMAAGATCLVIACDVADPATPAKVVGGALERFGRIDAVANVAGAAPLQPIQDITPAIWRENVDVNLSAPVLLTAAVWPTFQRQQSGVIVNVSSMSSIDPFPGFSIYGAVKIGLNLFTRCTADEGAAIGVRAVAVAPGAVETPMLRQHFNETMISKDKTMPPRAVAQVIHDCITGRRAFQAGETIVLNSE